MANTPVSFRPPQVATPQSLKGRNMAIAAGTEVVVGSVALNKFGHPALETIYWDGGAGSNNSLKFRLTLNGVTLPFAWNDSYEAKGAAGLFDKIGETLPPGGLLEIRIKNEHATDPFEGYCNGEVRTYDSPIS